MRFLQDRRVLAALIGLVVVLIALGGALSLLDGRHDSAVAPSSSAELKVVMGKSAKVQADTSVRCFANGQFVGMTTAADCAQKNGVAPGALDVGLDQSGAIAAGGGDTHLAPLAQADADSAKPDAPDSPRSRSDPEAADDGETPVQECKAYSPGGWRSVGQGASLDGCVHTLFEGRCPAPGQVIYGHWGALTLRASPGRIDASRNNRDFSPLAPQYPADCSIPPI